MKKVKKIGIFQVFIFLCIGLVMSVAITNKYTEYKDKFGSDSTTQAVHK